MTSGLENAITVKTTLDDDFTETYDFCVETEILGPDGLPITTQFSIFASVQEDEFTTYIENKSPDGKKVYFFKKNY